MNKQRILVTNDDGYKCIGYLSLLDKLRKDYDIAAVAPDKGKSWVGKSLSNNNIHLKKHNINGNDIISINGTPADCAQIGIYTLFKEKPDWVISGINIGENLGYGWIFSSGTVGASLEAYLQGIKSIAVSYRFPHVDRKNIDFDDQKNFHLYESASIVAKKVIDIIIRKHIPEIDFYIVNIPYRVKAGAKIEITKPYQGSYKQLYFQENSRIKFRTEAPKYVNMKPGTDLYAVGNDNIAITPIKIELAQKVLIEKAKSILT